MNLTPDQIAAIETIGANLCVDAGAGSGKTRVLVQRILHLIENRLADLDRIVAITFTENAAAEMKERLRRECRRRAPQDDPEKMSFWRDVERRVESARISTIHGFCSRLLRENALQLGLDPDFVVLPEAESHLLRTEVVTAALHSLLSREDPAAVRVASEFGLRRTRETLRSLLNRPALLEDIGRRFPVDDPAALRREWECLVEECRRRKLLEVAGDPWWRQVRGDLARFDGLCAKGDADTREAQRRHLLIHLDLMLANADADTIHKCLVAVRDAEAGNTGRAKNWSPPEAFKELGALADKLRDEAKKQLPADPDPAMEEAAAQLACDFYRTFLETKRSYDEAKQARTSLDFEDLILRALNTLREQDAIRARTARGIRFLLIDEFQDTDSVQFEIASLLAREEGGPELFIVGDAKQSIYNFRGADVDVFRQARDASDRIVPLARNFRTLPEIIRFINDLFRGSGLLRAVEPDYRGMEAHRDSCGQCRVEFLLPEANDPDLLKSGQRALEAELIAARLAEMCGDSPVSVCDPDTDRPRPANFGDVAILFRSLTDVYVYEQSLKTRGIPYTLVSGAGFYKRQEIVDLHNLLTLVADPWNEMALLAFLRSPIVGFSDEALLRFRGWGDDRRGLAHAFNSEDLPEDSDDAEPVRWAREILEDLRAHRESPLPELLRRVLDITGYEAILLDQFLGTQKASNVRKLLDLAHDFSRTRAPRLPAFLRYLDEVSAQEVREGEAALAAEGIGAVTLTTIHKAKGLEFPIVVVPDLSRKPKGGATDPVIVDRDLGLASKAPDEEGELQKTALYMAMDDRQRQREFAEEARILYVAMTRARDWLLLGSAPSEKNVRGSWFDTFRSQYNLLDRVHGEELSGDGWRAVVRRAADSRRIEPHKSEDTDAPLREFLEVRLGPVSPGRPLRRIFAVSDLLDRLPAQEKPRAADPREHLIDPRDRGIMLHMLFQHWDLKAPVRPLAETICRKYCPRIGARAQVLEDLVAVAERFQRCDFAQRIAAQAAPQREEQFLLRFEDAIVSGTVDLILDDGTVIDYKTGDRTRETRQRYEHQILLYALAHTELRGTMPPGGWLVYVDAGAAVPVSITPERLEETRRFAEGALTALRQPM